MASEFIVNENEKNEFAYVYFDSNGSFGEGIAVYDPASKSLKLTSIDKETKRKSVTISTFKPEGDLNIHHTFFDGNEKLLFKGEATYQRRDQSDSR